MTTTTSDNIFGPRPAQRSSWLLALVISLVAILAIGCGSSRDEFVFTGTGTTAGPGAQTGDLTFFFTQPQAQVDPTQVPAGTVRLAFEFFSGLDQTGTKTLADILRDYNEVIVISGVPVTTQSTRVTAIGADGIPLAVFTANITVVAGGNLDVALGEGTLVAPETVTVLPATAQVNVNGNQAFTATIAFDNGFVFQGATDLPGLVWSSSNEGVASVSNIGVATGLSAGNSNISAAYGSATVTPAVLTVNELPPISTLTSLEITGDPDPAVLAVGEEVEFTVFGTFVDGEVSTTMQLFRTDGVDLVTEPPSQSVLDFSDTDLSATGIATGTVTVFATVEGSDVVSEDGVEVTVGELAFSLFAPAFGSDDDAFALPSNGFQYRFLVEATHPNTTKRILESSELQDFGLSFSITNASVVSFVGDSPDTISTRDLGIFDSVTETTNVQWRRESSVVSSFDIVVARVSGGSLNLWIEIGEQVTRRAILARPDPYVMQVGQIDNLRVFLGFLDTNHNGYSTNITSSPQLQFGGNALTGGFVRLVNANQFLEALANTTDGDEPLEASISVATSSGTQNAQSETFILVGDYNGTP